jgi:uncharacterized protein YceK
VQDVFKDIVVVYVVVVCMSGSASMMSMTQEIPAFDRTKASSNAGQHFKIVLPLIYKLYFAEILLDH